MQDTNLDVKDIELCRQDFPSVNRTHNGKKLAYFDGPGGTQVPQQVIDAVADYYSRCNANTHGQFVTSHESDAILMSARSAAAEFLGASSPSEISFGANMTTLTILLSRAIGRALEPGDHVLITQLDHEANRGPWLMLEELGIRVSEVALKSDGTLDYDDLLAQVGSRTRVIAAGWASNALGSVNDLGRIREIANDVGALMAVDAVHYAPHFPVDVGDLRPHFLLCSAYKFYGPHVGVLYSRGELLAELKTDCLRTQDQEPPYRIETGTLNHAALAGVEAAIGYICSLGEGETRRERILSAMEKIGSREHNLAKRLYEGLVQIPGVRIFGPAFDSQRRAPTISFRLDGFTPEEVARQLGEEGILVWDGDFYAVRPAEIMGVSDRGGWVRVGMSLYNNEEEVDRLLAEVDRLAN